MKIRTFLSMEDSVFRIVINTEDWSEGDIGLMEQYGEPEIDVGGPIQYIIGGETKTKEFGSIYVRIFHGFPYSRGFDSRDYESVDEAHAIGMAWTDIVLNRIRSAIVQLRQNNAQMPTELIEEV